MDKDKTLMVTMIFNSLVIAQGENYIGDEQEVERFINQSLDIVNKIIAKSQ